MQPWSYNNSRRLDFASAIHRINTPMTQWPRIPVPISWSVQLNIDLYINTWAFFACPSDFVTVIDVRCPLRWERGRTTVPWLLDNTWNFIVDKIKRDCCGKYIKFTFCSLLDSCIHLHETEHAVGVLKSCTLYRQTYNQTSSRAHQGINIKRYDIGYHIG